MEHEKPVRDVVQEFLETHVKMVLAINEHDGEGYPNASLMHYAVGKDLHMYFGTKRAFGKYEALRKDPKVSYVVIEEGNDPLQVVDGRGIARELTPDEARFAYEYFKRNNLSKWYVEGAPDFAMFVIEPTAMRWLDATSGKLAVTEVE